MARKSKTTAEEIAISHWLFNAAMNYAQAMIYARRDLRDLNPKEHSELSQEIVDALLLFSEDYWDCEGPSAEIPTEEEIRALPTCGNA